VTSPIDSTVFIYLIEEHPKFQPLILPLFRQADEGKRSLTTSSLTLPEVLVVPYPTGNRLVAEKYEALLTRGRGRATDLSTSHTSRCEPRRSCEPSRW